MLLVVAVAKGLGFEDSPFNFWTHRYIDAATPVILLVLIARVVSIPTGLRLLVLGRTRVIALRVAMLGPLLLAIAILIGFSVPKETEAWRKMLFDYSWNTRNIEDEDVTAGRWINENTPKDATVLVFGAGAIRYFGKRFTYGVVGLNSKDLIGRSHVDIIVTEKPDYLAVWAIGVYEDMVK